MLRVKNKTSVRKTRKKERQKAAQNIARVDISDALPRHVDYILLITSMGAVLVDSILAKEVPCFRIGAYCRPVSRRQKCSLTSIHCRNNSGTRPSPPFRPVQTPRSVHGCWSRVPAPQHAEWSTSHLQRIHSPEHGCFQSWTRVSWARNEHMNAMSLLECWSTREQNKAEA